MPSIFGFTAIGLAVAAASVDCHLRVCGARLSERWTALRDVSEREARNAQRGQVIDMVSDSQRWQWQVKEGVEAGLGPLWVLRKSADEIFQIGLVERFRL
jgi:hypothetical protein